METKPPPYSPEYQHDFPVTNAPPPYSAGYPNAPPNVTYPAAPMYPAYQATAPPGYGTTVTVSPAAPVAAPIIVVGGCPSCRLGLLEDDFTCCGIFLAIFFFPLGILCCLAMRQKRCPRCGAVFG